VVALAADWDLYFHQYRLRLPQAELVLADAPGADALARAGIVHVRAANLCDPAQAFLDAPRPEGERDGPALQARRARRPALAAEDELLARVAEALGGPADPALVRDLAAAVARRPRAAALHNALGLAVAAAVGDGARPPRRPP
jgi:hypothetical protein